MSIPKAMALLGLGRENLRLIGADEAYRLDPQALRTAIAADRSAGRTPLAVVATGGSVNTGAIDPLPQIDRKSTRLNSSHSQNSYAGFCLKKKKKKNHYMQ